MPELGKISLILLGLGYEMDLVLMCGSANVYQSYNRAVEAMMIIAFLCYTAAVVLGLLINFGELKGNFIATVSNAVLDFVACLFLIIGLAVFGSSIGRFSGTITYPNTVFSVSLILAFIAGVLLAIDLAGGKGGAKTSAQG